MPIAEKTLKKWRKEALQYDQTLESIRSTDPEADTRVKMGLCKRILRMTQELLDQHLIRKE